MMSPSVVLPNALALGGTLALGLYLIRPSLVRSVQWRATVTPLASIIGSGFLIVAPLLHAVLGKWALAGMVVLSGVAYAIGAVIRFNIRVAEPHLKRYPLGRLARIERVAQWSLGFAYAISVAFYLSLLTSFVLHRLSGSPDLQRPVTTLVLLGVMAVAWWRGTRGLEWIEWVAVTIKLAIIGGVLIALASYDLASGTQWFQHEATVRLSAFDTAAVLAGMLMVTQGFETTRFMGHAYPADTRVKAGRASQRLSIGIYVLFIGLTCPLFLQFPITELSETTISQTLGQAVLVLPILLLIAATASQLSAALADTLGGGGLLSEQLPGRPSIVACYVALAAIAIVLVWSSNVFEIINFASKGFAAYYLLQAVIAAALLWQSHRRWAVLGCGGLLVAMVFVVMASIPAPHT